LSASALVSDDGHWNAGIGETHGDPAAHGAGADHGRALDLARLDVLGQSGDFRRLALGKEKVTLGLRLIARAQPHEGGAFQLQRVVERYVDRRPQHLDRGRGRVEAAAALGVGGYDLLERLRFGAQSCELVFAVARADARPLLRKHLAREGDARAGGVAFENFVDQSRRQSVFGRDRLAGQDHRRGFFHADEARQPLRAAGAGNEPELDFGQTEPRVGGGDAEVAGEGDLKPAAEWGAEHGGHDRLVDRIDERDHLGKTGHHRRLVEFGDVGAGNKGASLRGQHDRLHRRVVTRAREGVGEPRAHVVAQRVDRRIVDRDDGDLAILARRNFFPAWSSFPHRYLPIKRGSFQAVNGEMGSGR
jgi:hypothetical protein